MKMFFVLATVVAAASQAFAAPVATKIAASVPGLDLPAYVSQVAVYKVTPGTDIKDVEVAVLNAGFAHELIEPFDDNPQSGRCNNDLLTCAAGEPAVAKDLPAHFVESHAGADAGHQEQLRSYFAEHFGKDLQVLSADFVLPTDYTDDALQLIFIYNSETGEVVAFSDFEPGC